MPGFSLAVTSETFDDKPVAADAHERRKNGIGSLCDEEKKPCFCSGKADYFVEVNDEIGEPNGGAQIIEDVAGAVWNPLAKWCPLFGIQWFFVLLVANQKLQTSHFGVFCPSATETQRFPPVAWWTVTRIASSVPGKCYDSTIDLSYLNFLTDTTWQH